MPFAIRRTTHVAWYAHTKQANSPPSQIVHLPDHSGVIICFVIHLEYWRYLSDLEGKQRGNRKHDYVAIQVLGYLSSLCCISLSFCFLTI